MFIQSYEQALLVQTDSSFIACKAISLRLLRCIKYTPAYLLRSCAPLHHSIKRRKAHAEVKYV